MYCLAIIVASVFVTTQGYNLPYEPRSVPGRIRSSNMPQNVNDYISAYLDSLRQPAPEQYVVPEYEPAYQQGYISRKPQMDRDTLSAILPYLSQSELDDYSYDYNNGGDSPSPSYNDNAWYDEPADYPTVAETREKNNQDAALLRLFLDHLNGKYSLEDLETLERQALLEDNTENQLQSLMPGKKVIPPLPFFKRSHPTFQNFVHPHAASFSSPGQKEEPLVMPAANVRKQIITSRAVKSPSATSRTSSSKPSSKPSSPSLSNSVVFSNEKPPSFHSFSSSSTSYLSKPNINNKQKSILPKSSQSYSATSKLSGSKPSGSSSGSQTGSRQVLPTNSPKSETGGENTTMDPYSRDAYNALMKYLDQERSLRRAADEASEHRPHKRFVAESDSLSSQLSSLKKTVT